MIISYGQLFIRAIMVMFWLSCIWLFLYTPYLIKQVHLERSISVLAWPTTLDADYLKMFEQETGIKVHVSYYDTNEEMFIKLQAQGGSGYDLVMPSDYGAQLLIKHNLVKKIDRSQLTFLDGLYPVFNSLYYDPNNEYTIPFAWGVYGLGVDMAYFGDTPPQQSWALVFDSEHYGSVHISMLDDAREIALIAAQYLFGDIEHLNKERLNTIKQLLLKQKERIVMYTDMRTDYVLISKTAPVVMTQSSEIARIMKQYPSIDFIIPKEGSFIIVDTIAIPRTSEKDELIYQFINYLYKKDVLQYYVDKYGFLPTVNYVLHHSPFSFAVPTAAWFSQFNFFKNIIPEKDLSELWIAIKS